MAEVQVSNTDSSTHYSVLLWEGAANGGSPDTFEAIKLSRIPYTLTAHVTGTFGASGAVALHGSLNGTDYAALSDRASTAISVESAAMVSVGDAPLYIKPVLTGGDGTTDLDVTLLVWHESR